MTGANGRNGGGKSPPVACAIYCRVSTLDQTLGEFTSIDNQREMAEAYVRSQAAKRWTVVEERFDDPGYSANTLDRPALQRLIAAVQAGQLHVVIVYRLDRISRSLSDFIRLMDLFKHCGVEFVSVTENFSTDTPVGCLAMGIIAIFSEFESATNSARTRDKMSAARRRGRFCGGIPILGYDIHPDGGRLVLNEDEAEQVRGIFRLYARRQSLSAVVEELDRRGWVTKAHTFKTGRIVGGKAFSKSRVHALLRNPIYTGKVAHRGEIYPGEHDAIVTTRLFDRVQALLAENGTGGGASTKNRYGFLLRGLVQCKVCDAAYAPSTSRHGSKVYRYYICGGARQRGWKSCPRPSIPATKLESLIVDQIRVIGQDADLQRETLRQVGLAMEERRTALTADQTRLKRRVREARDQIRGLLAALANGDGGKSVSGRIAELEAEAEKLESRLTELTEALTHLDAETVDAADLAQALSLFDPVWSLLFPAEQERIIRLLIAGIEYDGESGRLAIEFRPNGIRALSDELAEDQEDSHED